MLDSFTKAQAVTPSDSTVVNCRGIYVGGAGNVAVLMKDDSAAVTFTAPPVGTVLPVAANKIMSTNTTATLLIALF